MMIQKERCPECAKRGMDTRGDNLARYEDGHAHCFGCGYHVHSTGTAALERVAKGEAKVSNQVVKPSDIGTYIDFRALAWLDQYGITRDEIIDHGIEYSTLRHALYFPIRVTGLLKAYQWRFLSNNAPSKWTTHGDISDVLHVLGKNYSIDQPLVIVEDIVSAIKVSRFARCLPLFGSNLSLKNTMRLKYLTKEVIFWLDGDKYAEAIKFAHRAGLLNIATKIIYTGQDPKTFTNNQIKDFIRA